MARSAPPTTISKGQGGHRDDHVDLAVIAADAMLASESFGGDSAPASVSTARTNLGLGSAATSNLSSSTPAATAASGTVGVGTTVARADHVHASPQLTATVPVALGSVAVGVATDSARQDHVHPTTGLLLTTALSAATPAATAATAAVGVSTAVSRDDHVHVAPQLSSTSPAALGSVAAGVATASARQDHVHPLTGLLLTSNLSAATPSVLASAGAAGSSSDVSKADHSHGVATAWTTYTPTFTNVTIGNGTSTGRYTLINAKLMAVVIQIGIGSTTSITGAIGVNLPGGVTGATTVPQRVVATAFDSSADTLYYGAASVTASDLSAMRFHGIPSTGGASVPFVWANGDNLRLWGLIELT